METAQSVSVTPIPTPRKLRRSVLAWIIIVLVTLVAGFYGLSFILPYPNPGLNAPQDVAPSDGRFIDVSGYTGYIRELNQSQSQTIVLLHGFAASGYVWQEVMPKLAAAGYRVVAIDLKGYGYTEKTLNTGFDAQSQAEYVHRILVLLGITQPIMVGHDMGGNIAIEYAQVYPDEVRKLILVDPFIETHTTWLYPWGLTQAPIQKWYRIGIELYGTKDRVKSTLQSEVYDSSVITDAVVTGYYTPTLISDWDLTLLGTARDYNKSVVTLPLSRGDLPVLVIWGKNDPVFPVSQADTLKQQIPQATVSVMIHTGHIPQEEQPTEFSKLVVNFSKIQ